MNLYEKKSKKDKVEFTQSGPDVTYTNPGEANSKERKAAIKDMLAKHSGGGAVKKYVKQKALKESLIVDYLIAEEFASSEKSAEAIMRHMSEEWLEHILYESKKGEKYAAALKNLDNQLNQVKKRPRPD